MKRAVYLFVAAILLSLTSFLQSDATASADPPPPGPYFDATIDETSPADPTIAPADDDCPVGLPCKIRTTIGILPNQPVLPIASVTPGAFFVAPDGFVPNGTRVGTTGFATTIAVSSIGPCDTNSIPYTSGTILVDATVDPRTSTGAPSDLASNLHWPRQLNDELIKIASHIPNPALWARYVGVYDIEVGSLEYYVPINILVIRTPGGSYINAYLVGDPSARNTDGSMQLGGPEIRLCSPFFVQTTIQGLAIDPGDGDFYALRVCLVPGPHLFAAIFIPLYPTADGPIVRVDPTSCSGQLADADGDGIPDLLDYCDNLAEDHDGIRDRDGCPELDADQDTIPDTADNCPQVPNPGQADNDDDSHGDLCDPNDDADVFPDIIERKLGSDPLDAASTPESFVVDGTCSDGLDNDGDAATDDADTGCHPYADFDGDRFPNAAEEHFGSDPNDAASTPEHFVLTPTCFDSDDNDLDGFTDTQDPGCFPFADSDLDGFIDPLESRLGSDPDNTDSTPEHYLLPGTCQDTLDNDIDDAIDSADDGCQPALDVDGDGFANALEFYLGSNPLVAASTPENIVFPETCTDDADNDLDAKVDFRDAGCLVLDVDGDYSLNHEDGDDDNDGFDDDAEAHVGTIAQKSCGGDGWPADIVSSGLSANKVNVQDLASFIAPVRHLGTNLGTQPGDERWDLVPGSTFGTHINIQDMAALVTTAPAMFGGVRAFGGPACQAAP